MEYIFLSHTSEDSATAERVSEKLKTAGYIVWASDGTGGGASGLSQQAIFSIKRSDAFLVVISAVSDALQGVAEELALASEAGKPIHALVLERDSNPTAVDELLSGVATVDVEGDLEQGIARVLAMLAGEPAGQEEREDGRVEWLADFSEDELGGLAALPGEDLVWSEFGYYWHKKWNTLAGVRVLLTSRRLIFIWNDSDFWKWKAREAEELGALFPIALSIGDIVQASDVQRDRILGILPSSQPYVRIETSDGTQTQFTLFRDFAARINQLQKMIGRA